MSDRILSPTESDVGREMGGVTLLKLVDCRSNNRALWVWRVRADGCGHEYEVAGRQLRERARDAAHGKSRDCYICSRVQIGRRLHEERLFASSIDRRLIPMGPIERLAHCERWL